MDVLSEADLKLQQLSVAMMKNEMAKMQSENECVYMTGLGYSEEKTRHEESVNRFDKKGYLLSLEMQETLFQNGMTFSEWEKHGPDAAYIAATNFLQKNGVDYPMSWHDAGFQGNKIKYSYDTSDVIDQNHESYLQQLELLRSAEKIDPFTYGRLFNAGDYFLQHHKALSKYHNGEGINNSSSFIRAAM